MGRRQSAAFRDAAGVYLFDFKYKRQGELIKEEGAAGRREKVDIEKMRAYRDAVRGDAGEGVVHYAAILYPGLETHYAQGLEALQAHPGREQTVEKQIAALPREALAP